MFSCHGTIAHIDGCRSVDRIIQNVSNLKKFITVTTLHILQCKNYFCEFLAGFLRPGLHGDVVTNFGLLDQIAALHWLQVLLKCLWHLNNCLCHRNSSFT